MKKLGVNIDHIATIREARGITDPDPVYAAGLVELAGADGIVVHLREDRRHIKDRDLKILRQVIKTRLLLEMAPTEEMRKKAVETLPEMVSLVPEKREELTTEGGLDLVRQAGYLRGHIASLKEAGIKVSVFIEPDKLQIETAAKLNADYIEIHTGQYANARSEKEVDKTLNNIIAAVEFAAGLGLGVNAGHGLNYFNVAPLVAVSEIEEFNIGHSIIARAVYVGLDKAVRDMKKLLNV